MDLLPYQDILKNFGPYRRLWVETEALQRSLLVECERNSSLIDCLELDKPGIDNRTPAFLAVAAALEVDVLGAVFDQSDLSVKAFGQLKNFNVGEDEGLSSGKVLSRSAGDLRIRPLTSLRRLCVRAQTVKTLGSLLPVAPDHACPDGWKDVQVKQRLRTLKSDYLRLARSIRKLLGSDL